MVKTYEEGYTLQQPMRKLQWHHDVGKLELDLQFADGSSQEVTCTPAQAGVLDVFSDDGMLLQS